MGILISVSVVVGSLLAVWLASVIVRRYRKKHNTIKIAGV